MKRRSILVPLDGSDAARQAIPYACALARTYGAGIELLSVVENLGDSGYADRLEAMNAEALGNYLLATVECIRGTGIAVDLCVRRGRAAETIALHAEKRRSCAVVMTTAGRGRHVPGMLGSVANGVIRLANCPVLTIGPNAYRPASVWWRPRRLLLPLDGSAQAEEALAPAYELAAMFGAEIVLVQAQPWLADRVTVAAGFVPDLSRLDREAGQAAAAYLQANRSASPSGVHLREIVLRGEPAEQLIDLARSDAFDLVVMTTHGHGNAGRLTLGGVADQVIRQGISTLVVHSSRTNADTMTLLELAHA